MATTLNGAPFHATISRATFVPMAPQKTSVNGRCAACSPFHQKCHRADIAEQGDDSRSTEHRLS